MLKTILITFAVSLFAVAGFADTTQPKPDPRLSIPITIECKGVRLHSALEQISEKTGVLVNCGIDKNDWEVRDIPVFIIAKDMPLNTLLHAIADSTHLLFSVKQANGKTFYRIWRDTKRRQELFGYEEKRKEVLRQAFVWDWDALCKLKDTPLPDKPTPAGERLRKLSRILAAIEPSVRDRVMADGGATVKMTELPESVQGDLKSLIDFRRKEMRDILISAKKDIPEYLLGDGYADGGIAIGYNMNQEHWIPEASGMMITMLSTGWGCSVSEWWDYQRAHPERPKLPPLPGAADPGSTYTKVFFGYNRIPALAVKVKLKSPEGRKPKFSDRLVGIASEADVSIVCEDFGSNRGWTDDASLYNREMSVHTLLCNEGNCHPSIWWYDEKNKLLLGQPRDWLDCHYALVPEATLDWLRDKASTTGLELDDVEPLVSWTQKQFDEWIDCDNLTPYNLRPLLLGMRDDSYWRLYFSLPASERTSVMSADGMVFEGERLTQLCDTFKNIQDNGMGRWGMPRNRDLISSDCPNCPAVNCPRGERSFSLRVWSWNSSDGRHGYNITHKILCDGKGTDVTNGGPGDFPIRGKKR